MQIGQGTYSCVYKAHDLETGKTVAMKKVRFSNMDPESVRFMAREIQILRKLDHPNIIQLEGIVASKTSDSLYLIFEYMDHDLAGILARPGMKLSESQVSFLSHNHFYSITLMLYVHANNQLVVLCSRTCHPICSTSID